MHLVKGISFIKAIEVLKPESVIDDQNLCTPAESGSCFICKNHLFQNESGLKLTSQWEGADHHSEDGLNFEKGRLPWLFVGTILCSPVINMVWAFLKVNPSLV